MTGKTMRKVLLWGCDCQLAFWFLGHSWWDFYYFNIWGWLSDCELEKSMSNFSGVFAANTKLIAQGRPKLAATINDDCY